MGFFHRWRTGTVALVIIGPAVYLALGLGASHWRPLADFALQSGGASGIAALVYYLTGIVVFYYFLETKKLRSATEKGQEPFLGLTFDRDGRMHENRPTIYLRNFGHGAAVNVDLKWTEHDGVLEDYLVHELSAVSPSPAGQAIVAFRKHNPDEVKHVRAQITCADVTDPKKSANYQWEWEKTADAKEFRLLAWSKTSG